MKGTQPLAIVLAVIILFFAPFAGAVSAAKPEIADSPFSDVPKDHPHRDDFALLSVLGIFEGYGDGTVGPDNAVTRAEFAKIAVSMLGESYLVPSLSDLQPNFRDGGSMAPHWWGWINAAEYLGLVRGFGDRSFRPDSPLRFAEATAVLLRAAGYEAYLQDVPYPQGYLERARSLGITGGISLASDVPITRSEMARMVVNAMSTHPPTHDGMPADGQTGVYRETLLEQRQERVTGTVEEIRGASLIINGAEYALADQIHLIGADAIDDLRGARVIGYKGGSGGLEYVRAAQGAYTVAGVLENASLSGRFLYVNGVRLGISTSANARDRTRWILNGKRGEPSASLWNDMIDSGDVYATVQAFNGQAEEVTLEYWDGGSLCLLDVPREEGDQWSVPVSVLGEEATDDRELKLHDDLSGLFAGSDSIPAGPGELETGDILRVATVGAEGLGDGVIEPRHLYRVERYRSDISGDVERVELSEEDDELLMIFTLDDGQEVRLRADRYQGGPRDMSLNDLRHASWVHFVVDDDGYALLGLDAYVSGAGARYVRILTIGALGGQYHIVVEQAGVPVTYQLAFPALWVRFTDADLRLREGEFAELSVNPSGKVEGVRTWVSTSPDSRPHMVVSVDAEEEAVRVRALNEAVRDPEVEANSLIEAREPAVYDADDRYVGLEGLSPGQRACVYYSDRGEIAVLRLH